MTARVGALLWIFAATAYFTAEAIAAAGIPGYDYATDYVSQLGEPARSPHAAVMNAAFAVQGVLFPAGAYLLVCGSARRKAKWFLAFAGINGLGNLLVATVHSGAGALWHQVGAVMAIGGGNAAVLAGASALSMKGASRRASQAMGALGLLGLLVVAFELAPIGVWERLGVYAIFAWQAATAVAVLVGRRLATARGIAR